MLGCLRLLSRAGVNLPVGPCLGVKGGCARDLDRKGKWKRQRAGKRRGLHAEAVAHPSRPSDSPPSTWAFTTPHSAMSASTPLPDSLSSHREPSCIHCSHCRPSSLCAKLAPHRLPAHHTSPCKQNSVPSSSYIVLNRLRRDTPPIQYDESKPTPVLPRRPPLSPRDDLVGTVLGQRRPTTSPIVGSSFGPALSAGFLAWAYLTKIPQNYRPKCPALIGQPPGRESAHAMRGCHSLWDLDEAGK